MKITNYNVRWIIEFPKAQISIWKTRQPYYFYTRGWWQFGRIEYRAMLSILLLALASLACLQTTIREDAGTAAASTPPLPTEGTPFEHPAEEDYAGAVWEPTFEPARGLCAIVTADEALHLRAKPSEHSQVIEWLLSGEEVRVIEPGAEWSRVRTISGLEGHAKAKYLQEEKCQK